VKRQIQDIKCETADVNALDRNAPQKRNELSLRFPKQQAFDV